MLRATPARAAAAAAAAAARRFQSAHAAQAGWQQMVKQAQEQSIKGTASVVATSRAVAAAERKPEAEADEGIARSTCAATSASAWQQMVYMANKVGSDADATIDQAKVTMKVGCGREGPRDFVLALCLYPCRIFSRSRGADGR